MKQEQDGIFRMNAGSIHFQCPHCHARVKAAARLVGQTRACPGCGRACVIRAFIPDDAGPLLVPPVATIRHAADTLTA